MKQQNSIISIEFQQQTLTKKIHPGWQRYPQEFQLQQDQSIFGPLRISIQNLKRHCSQLIFENLLQKFQRLPSRRVYRILEAIPEFTVSAVKQYKGVRFFMKYVKWWDLIQNGGYQICLKNISHIHFSSLKSLNLQNCQLSNIQVLSYLSAPSLCELKLLYNKISNINPLIKANFPQLQILSIQNNKINQTEKLNRLNFKKLNFFSIDPYGPHEIYLKQITEDIRFLMKLENSSPKKILLQSPHRIHLLIKSLLLKLNQKGNQIKLIDYTYQWKT